MSAARVWLWCAVVCLVIVPAGIVLIQSIGGDARPIEIWLGAVVSTAFFSASNAVAVLHTRPEGLKDALMISYVVKIVLLLGIAVVVGSTSIDRVAFGLAIAACGIVHVTLQAILYSRSMARERSEPESSEWADAPSGQIERPD